MQGMSRSEEMKSGTLDKLKRFVPVAIIGLGAAACGGAEGGDDYEKNPNVTSVTIHEGANIRSEPHKADSDEGPGNKLATLEKPATLKTPDGVTTSEDRNGVWVQLPAKDVAGILDSQGQGGAAKRVEGDEDGKVWVNWQKATTEGGPDSN